MIINFGVQYSPTHLSIRIKLFSKGLFASATKAISLFVSAQVQPRLDSRPAHTTQTLVGYLGLIVVTT